MNEKNLKALLGQADFSKGTDLKERLRRQLFASNNVVAFPVRRALNDDDLEFVNAAALEPKKIPTIFDDDDKK